MSFEVAAALRRSTGRAKSDVANKLVSMFLHEVSRKACAAANMSISDFRYSESVLAAFGTDCLYCGGKLEPDRATVEHLNGMNRVCVGLHVPGNVAMACKRCNNEKRRDDQRLFLLKTDGNHFSRMMEVDANQIVKAALTGHDIGLTLVTGRLC